MKNRYFKHKQNGQVAWLTGATTPDMVVLQFSTSNTTSIPPGRFRRDYEAIRFEPDARLPDEPARAYSYFLDFLTYEATQPGQLYARRSFIAFHRSLPKPRPGHSVMHKWSQQYNWLERAETFDLEILDIKRQQVRKARAQALLGKEPN